MTADPSPIDSSPTDVRKEAPMTTGNTNPSTGGRAGEETLREYLQWVTTDLHRTRQRLDEVEQARREPLAVLGMACRFPGGIASPEELWELVERGGTVIGDMPTDRGWDVAGLFDPDPDAVGRTYCTKGGFLDDVAGFDAEFFGISPREALAMDPQQRLLLEVAWEAIERAGLEPGGIAGTRVGVFVGSNQVDYGWGRGGGNAGIEGYLGTGNTASVLSGRLAYVLGLEGPALTVDTACSSSLVALHSAAAALRAGEIDRAVVGGVTVMSTPAPFLEFARQRGLAADGVCKAFAEGADGMVLSEGVGVLVLERLSDAQRVGRPVRAVVRGSAVNQDGASNGLTAPSGPAQERVIRAAVASAGLNLGDVDLVEAHGTGTALGDPIEAGALLATYGRAHPADRPLWLGSVKSNIGHTQAAAGVAGVIKAVTALERGVVPGSVGCANPTTVVDWTTGAVTLADGAHPWPETGAPRRAAVSSFGVSGTNAHVVLEQVPDRPEAPAPDAELSPVLRGAPIARLTSAASAPALAGQIARLAEHGADPAIARALLARSCSHAHRAVVCDAAPVTGRTVGGPGPVWVFSGQGGQWAGMAADLLESSPVFAEAFAEVAAALREFVAWDPVEILTSGDDAWLTRTEQVQPLLWAVMVALARWWRAVGVEPAAVVGHSQGEVAAAVVAGVLSVQDGARVVCARSRLVATVDGTMALLAGSAEQVHERLAAHHLVGVAARNGPTDWIVSGPVDAVEALVEAVQADGGFARRIAVEYAAHSPAVEAVRDELLAELADIRPGRATVAWHSTVTSAPLDGPEADAGYWYRNLRCTVEFRSAIAELAVAGHRHFVEVSPHPTLGGPVADTVAECAEDAPVAVHGTLRRDQPDAVSLITAAAQAWVAGAPVDWDRLLPAATPAAIATAAADLPTYAFDHHRYWLDPDPTGGDASTLGQRALDHPLLRAAVQLADRDELLLTGVLDLAATPWLADHAVSGTVLFPGTGFVELALAAADEVGCPRVEELTLQEPLVLDPRRPVRVQLHVEAPTADGTRLLRVSSQSDDTDWVTHAECVLSAADVPAEGLTGEWPPAGATPLDVDGFYPAAAEAGYGYGPSFTGLRRAWSSGTDLYAEVELPAELRAKGSDGAAGFGVHPVLLDAALHAMGLADGASTDLALPFTWAGVQVHAVGAASLRVRLRPDGPPAADGSRRWSVLAADTRGEPVVSADALTVRPVRGGATGSSAPATTFAVDWVPLDVPATATDVLAVADVPELVAAIERGERAVPAIAMLTVVPEGTGPDAALRVTTEVLAAAQAWIAAPALDDAVLAIVTRGAVDACGSGVDDLAAAPVWGLVRSAQSENPGRFVLVDQPAGDPAAVVAAAVAAGENQVAVRAGAAHVARLVRTDVPMPPMPGPGERLDADGSGTASGVTTVEAPDADLGAGEVRVAVRAAGVNFRDVLIALGLYGAGGIMGTEVAGEITEVGPDVSGLAVGDRVMGIVAGGFAPSVVTDARLVTAVPDGWTWEQAAAVPIAWVTAWAGLADLGGVGPDRPGSVLVHAAAGGVGGAAVALAQHWGCEVFATAAPAKHDVLRAMGLDDDHIGSSRDASFADVVRAGTGGRGVDVVLNSLAGPLLEASEQVLAEGGRFVEIGRTDSGSSEPGYRFMDLDAIGRDRVGEILAAVRDALAAGLVPPARVTVHDVRGLGSALADMAAARHVGKLVVRMPRAVADGTVLVTGGTGTLGRAVARHLVTAHGARRIALLSRRGPAADGVSELVAELAEHGAHVEALACDVTDREALAAVVAGAGPISGVVHAAGALADATLGSLTPEALAAVAAPKIAPAWYLHELVRDDAPALFALFSSAAGVFGGVGQGNYAAANTFLDALAAHRRGAGLAATSLAWGLWETRSELTGHLSASDTARMAAGGVRAMSEADSLAALDAAVRSGLALAVPVRFDRAALARASAGATLPPIYRALLRGTRRTAANDDPSSGLAARVAQDPRAATRLLLDEVRRHVAAVLALPGPGSVDADRSFTDMGFDSLTAVELRNRLATATGVRLPSTVVFDHPNPGALARHLVDVLGSAPAGPVTTAPRPAAEQDDPIVVVATACRYPGGIASPEDLWELVAGGGDAIGPFPADRGWDLAALASGDTSHTAHGGFLHEAPDFDPDPFGISPREALAMDPQQRLVLETTWEVLERAGITPAQAAGSRTGVYVGAVASGYGPRWSEVPDEVAGYLATGAATSVVAGRVSYVFGLEGPALTVDTACSSSLVALHLAAQALRNGECDMALAGGVTVMPTPVLFVEFSRQDGLARDGRCKAFDAAADGFGAGEGAGMLLLERESAARRRGHRILAVLRGSAVNSDGASNGLTAPNGPSQQRVIRAALQDARLGGNDIDVVEAHGTGTALGDPIEAQALIACYGSERDAPLRIGSVKSNIGHTQAAAGVAGVIKVIEAMRHELLPGTLHVAEPTPHVDWDGSGVELATAATPWPRGERARRAGVSSFGISGTNAHVIVEEAAAESIPPMEPEDSDPPRLPWLLSAATEPALRALAGDLRARLDAAADAGVAPAAIAHALATTRAPLAHRAVLPVATFTDAEDGLTALAAGAPGWAVRGQARPAGALAMTFSGQGAQRPGMGAELHAAHPAYAATFDAVCERFDRVLDRPLASVVQDGELLDRTEYTQPALFAHEVALHALLESWGIVPDLLLGHSIGGISAAHVGGILDLDDAVTLVAARGRLMQALPTGGAMCALEGTEEEVRAELDGPELAAVNGPTAVVVSGTADEVAALAARWRERGRRVRELTVSHAFHSRLMEPVLAEFAEVVAGLQLSEPRVPVVSDLTGRPEPDLMTTPEYWVRHARETVRFADGVAHLVEAGAGTVLEIGPTPVLTGATTDTVRALDADVEVLATAGTAGERDALATAVARLHVRGVLVDWTAIVPEPAGPPADLPTYPFQRQRFWLAPDAEQAAADPIDAEFWTAVEAGELPDGLAGPGWEGVLPGLTQWRQRRRGDRALDDLRYEVSWQPLVPDSSPAVEPVIVLVPAGIEIDASDVSAALPNPRVFEINAATATQAQLAVLLDGDGSDVPITVVSLLGCDTRPLPDAPGLTCGLAATDALTRVVVTRTGAAMLRIVTRGAVAAHTADAAPDPLQAAVWGYGRAVALEHPRRWGGLVDLPAEELSPAAIGRLGTALTADVEDQLAVRTSGVFARRLGRAAPAAPDTTWTPHGRVLVTGGTGALGGAVARWLAEHGATDLVLLGRRGAASPGADELVAELAALGASAQVVACDAADADALTAAITDLAGTPFTAVVHAAGVGQVAPILDTDRDDVHAVVAGKLTGALVLDAHPALADVEQFVLFGSVAGVWGSGGGQAAYAAANAALDALAQARRARGVPATSVAWGPWSGGGMATADTDGKLADRGLAAIDPAVGTAVLARCVGAGDIAVTCADVAWDRFLLGMTAARPRPFLAGMAPPPEPTARRELTHTLDTAGIERAVHHHIGAVLGRPGEPVEPGRALSDLGFDSMTAVELSRALVADTGLDLPSTLVFDHPTAAALTRHLCDQLGLHETSAAGPVQAVRERGTDRDDDVVIVSMACRYPGAANPEELWELVAGGTDAVTAFPDDRGWDLDTLIDPDPDHPGTSYVDQGGFLDDVAGFDAGLFGIAPREAVAMDPQQRLLLHVAWETIERAGIDPRSLAGSATGVFVGAGASGYAVAEATDGHALTGNVGSVLSGRIAYVFGLEGPAVTLDTACSSSLVALHWAAQALRSGECDRAIAGGVSVLAAPDAFVEFSRQRGLAPDGRCKPFAEAADGTGWGEGVGLLLLERRADAERLGHDVLAVVAGSAVNSDGASNGLTAPNGPSQQRVIRAALAAAGIGPDDVDVVEAHGTGTPLGDPIEAQALLATYGDRSTDRPLLLGSVKSNIGHAAAAAGAAGVIKTVMAMRHGRVAPTIHIDAPTSQVDWAGGTVTIPTSATDWPEREGPRRAAISGFGISGTNAHVVLEAGDPVAELVAAEPSPAAWPLSAADADGVARAAELLAEQQELHPADPAAIGRALAATRATHRHRAVVTGRDHAELVAGCRALAAGDVLPASVVRGTARAGTVAFVFPGQGAQWAGMAADLAATSPVFAARLEECSAAAAPYLPFSLADRIRAGVTDDDLAQVDVVQPLLWAVLVALAAEWEHRGVRPDAVVGHSQGEIAAACVAGALSLEDGAAVVALRARAIAELMAGAGGMVSVALGASAAEDLVGRWPGRLAVAAHNGPESVVLSGDSDAIDEVLAATASEGVWSRRVAVDYASHSPHVELLRDRLAAELAHIRPRTATVPIISTVTGGEVDGADMDAGYWYANLRSPVLLDAALRALPGDGPATLVEVGPHPVLVGALQDVLQSAGRPVATVATLRRDEPGPVRMLAALGEAWAAGVAVDWDAALPPRPGRLPDLPTYPFLRTRYWLDQRQRDVVTVAEGPVAEAPEPVATWGPRVAAAPPDRQLDLLTGLVSEEVAAVLGHGSGVGVDPGVDPDQAFSEMGFTSLLSVDARNRLGAATGLELPSTLLFTHPTVDALARHLLERLAEPTGGAPGSVEDELDRLERAMQSADSASPQVRKRLAALLERCAAPAAENGHRALSADAVRDASADELLSLIDRELGAH